MADSTYDNIVNPYNNQLLRSDNTPAMNDITDVAQNEGGRTIKSGSTLTDCWIDTWIKSSNYSPKKKGFFLDALNGYIEGTKFAVGTGIEWYGNDAYFYDFSAGGKGIATVSINSGGTGYAVGNILTIVQSWAAGGEVRVSSVNPTTGAITGITIYAVGAGYAIGTNNPTTGGGGIGATIDILSLTTTTNISGDTSSFVFQRAFYPNQEFLIQKRVGVNSASDSAADNVMEFFYPNDPQSGRKNYLFLGVAGNVLPPPFTGSISDFKTNAIGIHAKDLVQVGTSVISDHNSWATKPVNEITLFTSYWGSPVVFNSGASRIFISAIQAAVAAPYNWVNGSGGACVGLGIQKSIGNDISLMVDESGGWFCNNFFPNADNSYTLGDLSHTFSSIYVYSAGSLFIGNKALGNSAGTLTWGGSPIGGISYGPFILTSDGTSGGTEYGRIDTDSGYYNIRQIGRNIKIGTSSYTTFFEGAAIAPVTSGGGSCGLASNYWSNVYTNNVSLSTSYINYESGSITFHAQTNTQGSVMCTGDLRSGTSSGSCIIGSSGGYLVSRGHYCYAQQITYKDGSGVNQTKWFMVE